MKYKILPAFLPVLFLAACAGVSWPTVGSTLIADVQSGTVAAADAFAAYQAVNQQLTTANVTTGKLDVTKVLAAATAITQAAADPSLQTAVNSFVSDANATITALKGSSPTAVIAAVSNQGAGTVSTIAALPAVSTTPPTPSSTMLLPSPGLRAPYGEHNAYAVLRKGHTHHLAYLVGN